MKSTKQLLNCEPPPPICRTIVGSFGVVDIGEREAERRLRYAYNAARENNMYALIRRKVGRVNNDKLSWFVPGIGVHHNKISLLQDDTVIWSPGSTSDPKQETPLEDMMEYYTSRFFERPHQVYWTVFNDGTLMKMLLPLNKPIQIVNAGGESTPLGVLVVDKQNPDGKVYEWKENIKYNGFQIFHFNRYRAHAIIRETRRKYSGSPAVLIRTGTHTTIGSDGTFENLVLTYDYGEGPKDVLFSCTQHVNLVRAATGTIWQFEYMIAKGIGSLTFYKITGVDPVTAEERQFSYRGDRDLNKGRWNEGDPSTHVNMSALLQVLRQ